MHQPYTDTTQNYDSLDVMTRKVMGLLNKLQLSPRSHVPFITACSDLSFSSLCLLLSLPLLVQLPTPCTRKRFSELGHFLHGYPFCATCTHVLLYILIQVLINPDQPILKINKITTYDT